MVEENVSEQKTHLLASPEHGGKVERIEADENATVVPKTIAQMSGDGRGCTQVSLSGWPIMRR